MASITIDGSNSGQQINGDGNVITVSPGTFEVRVSGSGNNISGGTGPNNYVTQGPNNSITVGTGGGTFTAVGDKSQVAATGGSVTGTIQGDGSTFTGGTNPIQLRVIGDRSNVFLNGDNANANVFLLQGNGFVFSGGKGADTISAVGVNNILTGGDGADTFAFVAGNNAFGATDLSNPTVTDFQAGTDRIAVLISPNAAYANSLSGLGLTPQSTLAAGRFEAGGAATNADTRFVYNPANGQLLFTPFGNAQNAVDVVATLQAGLSLGASSIFISNTTDALSASQSPVAGAAPGGDPFPTPAPSGGGYNIAAAQPGVVEGNYGASAYNFVVTRDAASAGAAATLAYAVTGAGSNPSSAREFVGGTLPSGTVTFAPNETSRTITVPIQGNTYNDGNTAFQVGLTGAGVNIAALGFITDDDNYRTFTGTPGNDTFQDTAYGAPYNGDLYIGGAGRDALAVGATFRGSTVGVAPNGDAVLVHQGHTDVLRGMEEADFVDGRLVFDPNDVAAQVVRMYQAGLGRNPDQGGLNFWIGRLQQGATLGQIAQGFLGSPEFVSRFGDGLPDADFVNRIYLNVLGRPPEQGGFNFWVGRLQAGASRQDVLAGIAESNENKTITASLVQGGIWDLDEGAAQVARMYDTVLGRLPDVGGLAYWTQGIDSGRLTLQNMADQFVGSAEFQKVYGSLSNRDFVQTVYGNTLHRPGDQAGVDYWTSRLDQGATRAQVVTGFSESPEHQALTAANIRSENPGQYGILTA